MPGPVPLQLTKNSFVAGMQRLTVSSGAVGLTVPNDKVFSAFMKLASGPIYYTVDGSVPSASNGIEMVDGETAVLNLHEMLKFQAIRGSVDGVLTIAYYQSG